MLSVTVPAMASPPIPFSNSDGGFHEQQDVESDEVYIEQQIQ